MVTGEHRENDVHVQIQAHNELTQTVKNVEKGVEMTQTVKNVKMTQTVKCKIVTIGVNNGNNGGSSISDTSHEKAIENGSKSVIGEIVKIKSNEGIESKRIESEANKVMDKDMVVKNDIKGEMTLISDSVKSDSEYHNEIKDSNGAYSDSKDSNGKINVTDSKDSNGVMTSDIRPLHKEYVRTKIAEISKKFGGQKKSVPRKSVRLSPKSNSDKKRVKVIKVK